MLQQPNLQFKQEITQSSDSQILIQNPSRPVRKQSERVQMLQASKKVNHLASFSVKPANNGLPKNSKMAGEQSAKQTYNSKKVSTAGHSYHHSMGNVVP
jgi:hypothetical protein